MMIRHLIKRFLYSLTGRKHQGYYHYSSSDYKKGHFHPHNRPPQYPPQGHQHYGHGYYKKKYSSFSS
ncbi:MAG: hypothetical protein ACQEXQ_14390 [Bacillota bacterium]|uniref:Uncharacterized protein n=1 Tax=Paenibacillus prosopidis TaxID=630520 RepID=A0A368W1Z9_9BACL|nr:hypothetical protein [Paenibacillus prosopidis]RCW47845.1 hypothetical protein DFP97_10744 [Paenibacillus prosopidis]